VGKSSGYKKKNESSARLGWVEMGLLAAIPFLFRIFVGVGPSGSELKTQAILAATWAERNESLERRQNPALYGFQWLALVELLRQCCPIAGCWLGWQPF